MTHNKLHSSEHVDGTDDIQLVTNSQKGLAFPTHRNYAEDNTESTHTGNGDWQTKLTLTTELLPLDNYRLDATLFVKTSDINKPMLARLVLNGTPSDIISNSNDEYTVLTNFQEMQLSGVVTIDIQYACATNYRQTVYVKNARLSVKRVGP